MGAFAAANVEHKAVLFSGAELKVGGGDGGPGTLEGYASVFRSGDERDEQGDQIVQGAFKGTLDFTTKEGFLGLNHDWTAGAHMGMFDALSEDPHGLYFKGTFYSTPTAQSARTEMGERLAAGKKVPLSIGYVPEQYDFLSSGIRQISQVKLFEVSYVSAGADGLAEVRDAKDFGFIRYAEELDRLLASLKATTGRTKAITSLRAKEGRQFSAANIEKLKAIYDGIAEHHKALGELLKQTDPAKQNDVMAQLIAFEATRARLNGVAVAA